MKKWFALAVVAVLAILAVATVVSAQTPQPQSTPQPGTPGYGRGMMGGGMRAGLSADDDGLLHDAMVAALAEKLGLTASDLQARLDKGETMWQIAESKGLTADQFKTWMVDTRNAAVDAAVKAGTITQEQADLMKQRGQNMRGYLNGMDPEDCPMNGDGAVGRQQGMGMMGRASRTLQGGSGRGARPSTTTP